MRDKYEGLKGYPNYPYDYQNIRKGHLQEQTQNNHQKPKKPWASPWKQVTKGLKVEVEEGLSESEVKDRRRKYGHADCRRDSFHWFQPFVSFRLTTRGTVFVFGIARQPTNQDAERTVYAAATFMQYLLSYCPDLSAAVLGDQVPHGLD